MGHRVSALEDILKDDHQVVLAAWTLGAWAAACEVKQGDYVVQPIHGDSHPRSQSWLVNKLWPT